MYKVNVEILKMLKETEFAPTNVKTLGLFINTPKLYGNLSNYFKWYTEWFLEVYNLQPKRLEQQKSCLNMF